MKSAMIFPMTLAALLCAGQAQFVRAQNAVSPSLVHASGPSDVDAPWSSSAQPEDVVPDGKAVVTGGYGRALGGVQTEAAGVRDTRPFRSLSLTAKFGSNGIGFDVSAPVAPHLQVRGGAQFYSQSFGFTTDGIDSNASLNLRNVALSLDVFPFHNSFHLSPGVAVDNGNRISDLVSVPAGQTFTLGNTDYKSSPTDPVHGTAALQIGKKIAPRFTLGWEHRFGHISFPTEFGFQYTGPPTISLSLSGTACNQLGCMPVSSAAVSGSAQQEVVKLQDDLHFLRFYPITSTGIRYTFGGR